MHVLVHVVHGLFEEGTDKAQEHFEHGLVGPHPKAHILDAASKS